MKRCPTCNRTFSDPNLSFCIEDGTPLVMAEPAYDSEATIVSSSSSAGGEAKTHEAPSDWNAPAYQPPPQFPPPPPSQKRRIWPWVVGSLALVVLVIVGLGIAAALIIPQMMKETTNRNNNRSGFPANTGFNENRNPNSNANVNSNSAGDNRNENNNENDSNTAPPTNEEVVLSDLKNLEDEWTVANLNADKKKLDRILADDYVGTNVDGSMQGKGDYLKDIKPDPTIQHWEFQTLKLTLNGSRATLSGIINLESSQQNEPLVLRFTDKFVWRDGRWQAVASEVKPIKD